MATNSGGREKFQNGQEVQILLLAGNIDPKTFIVEPEPLDEETGVEQSPPDFVRADRKGHVPLREKDGTRTIKIHFRRILPLNSDGKATVVESSDKYRAICPICGNVFNVEPNCERITCPDDGEFYLNWLGAKPMTTDTEKKTKTAQKADDKADDKPKAEKATKAVKEPILVDFDALKKLPGCELWTKPNVKFDHPEVDVKAHCLLLTGDSPRKYCFNTYNGALGKKSQGLATAEFLTDTAVAGGKRERPWFVVKDLEKAQASLTKSGYEKA